MEYYDEYIALGSNCEIGFQFRRYGKEPSSLFSWLVSDIDKIINVTSNDFSDFYNFEDLVPHTHNMVKSKKNGLCFHSKLISKKSLKTKKLEFIESEKVRKEYYNNEHSKYNYLIKKWNNLVNSESKVAYFIKDESYSDEKILMLETHIKQKYPTHKFRLIVIKENENFIHQVLSDNLTICSVRQFSDIHYSWASDLDLWDKIFKLYPLKNGENIDGLAKNSDFLVNGLSKFIQNQHYSFSLHFNISQFFEKIGFLNKAIYHISEAKKLKQNDFVEAESLRLHLKLMLERNKKIEEKNNLIKEFYFLNNVDDINYFLFKNNLLLWKYNQQPIEITLLKEVRYIRFSLQEDICFHLNEIEIWNAQNQNIALGKELVMSSTYKSEYPLSNKNTTNGKIHQNASFHTKTEKNPWVVLDLGSSSQVKLIKIFNREGEYSTRALSILVETSNNLKDWEVDFDNYFFRKQLVNSLLSKDQINILDNIYNNKNLILLDKVDIKILFKTILEEASLDSKRAKFVKYALMLKVKSFYQIKVEVKKVINTESELIIVNDAVKLLYGNNFLFSLENSLEKRVNLYPKATYGIELKLDQFFNLFDRYDKNSDEYTFILYTVLCKYRAIARLNGELLKSKNKLKMSQTIQTSIDFLYGEGHVFTQHGITKSINKIYNFEDKINVVKSMNCVFEILKNKLNIDAYIVSGTLLGAVRNGEFIPHDDDFDSAYLSNEILYPNIWLETLQIVNVLPYKVKPMAKGILHLKVIDNGVTFKLDLFTGWIENNFLHRYPVPPKKVTLEQMRPFKKIKLYNIDVPIPANPEAVLANNYGEKWKTPDPTFRFDWKMASENYKDSLISLKNELPTQEWIFNNLPLVTTHIENTLIISSQSDNDVYLEIRECSEIVESKKMFIIENYFLVDSQFKHNAFIRFAKETSVTVRYVGRLNNTDVLIELSKYN